VVIYELVLYLSMERDMKKIALIIEKNRVMWYASAAIIGGFLGIWVVRLVSEEVMRMIWAVAGLGLVLIIAYFLIFRRGKVNW